jgi:hypothetical protein
MPSSSRKRIDLLVEERVEDIAEAPDELEILGAGQIGVEMGLLGHVSQEGLVFLQVREHLAAVELDAAARRLDEAHQNLDGGAFTRTIRTEQSKDLARPDLERHMFRWRSARRSASSGREREA